MLSCFMYNLKILTWKFVLLFRKLSLLYSLHEKITSGFWCVIFCVIFYSLISSCTNKWEYTGLSLNLLTSFSRSWLYLLPKRVCLIVYKKKSMLLSDFVRKTKILWRALHRTDVNRSNFLNIPNQEGGETNENHDYIYFLN